MEVRALLQWAMQQLDPETARPEAEILLAHVLNKDRTWLFIHHAHPLDTQQAETFKTLVARRQSGEPVAYLTGTREFWSLPLAVSPHVLVPRPETELLIEEALKALPQNHAAEVLDLGTGSGAIAIAIGKERQMARIVAVDISHHALAVAEANARTNRIANIEFRQSDWFEELGDARFDLIVANPPYLAGDDPHLAQGDLRFEPQTALVAGENGLRDIRLIIQQARSFLNPNGNLMIEHGYAQGHAVRQLFEQAGFAQTRTCCDLAGHERITCGRRR